MATQSSSQATKISRIVPAEAESFGSSAIWLDVRTPAEYEEVHIEGAQLHPLSDLDAERVRGIISAGKPCIVICRSGNRAAQAAEKLATAGITDLHILEGGLAAWDEANLPVKRGAKTISLERQVRIAAGALVFVGTLLGVAVHGGFLIIPAFVGAGLVFAGVTDTCGMGMVLARMPWNQKGGKACRRCAG